MVGLLWSLWSLWNLLELVRTCGAACGVCSVGVLFERVRPERNGLNRHCGALSLSSPSLSSPRYSAFRSSKKKIKNDLTKTDLEQLIRDKNVSDVYVVGLATEVRYYEHVQPNPAAMGVVDGGGSR